VDIARYRASIFDGVPTMWMFLLNAPELKTADFSSLRLGCSGGQTIPVATLEKIERTFGIEMMEVWGMTELAGVASSTVAGGLKTQARPGSLILLQFRVVGPRMRRASYRAVKRITDVPRATDAGLMRSRRNVTRRLAAHGRSGEDG
jgi:acyl-CoA synthetase (AMP-forming)/AMP-acid ligase II